MIRLATVVVLAMLMAGCRTGRWAWVEETTPIKCRGGTINTERRVTDVGVYGRTRTTTYRTDACID